MEESDRCSGKEVSGAGAWRRRVERRLPVMAWARRYTREMAVADAVAGVTLGLTLVPQAIAYAALAGLPVHYGLYSSFMGTILYALLGTVKEVSIGPTSLMALLTLQACRGLPPQYLVLLTFCCGVAVLLMALLRLGFLVELISPAVTSGFTTGTALIIIAAQLKGLLGLSFMAESLVENVTLVAQRLHLIRTNDCLLAAGCCVTLLLLRRLKDIRTGSARMKRVLFLVSISRNALVVTSAALLAYSLHHPDHPPFKLSGLVQAGLPQLSLPPLSVTQQIEGRNVTVGLGEMMQELSGSLLLMPVVMVLANIAIAKAFSGSRPLDASQEMVALGVCNMAGALVHSMPTCGAFTRSAVAHSSGVQSPAAGLYCGALVLVALSFLTPCFYFIPKACLSSVLVCAVIFMIDIGFARRLWRSSRSELCVWSLTVLAAVLCSVELAVLLGATANVAALLLALAHAPLDAHQTQISGRSCVVVRLPAALVYVNSSRAAMRISRAARQLAGGAAPVLLDARMLALIDHSALQMLERLMQKHSGPLAQPMSLCNVPRALAGRLSSVAGAAAAGPPAAALAALLGISAADAANVKITEAGEDQRDGAEKDPERGLNGVKTGGAQDVQDVQDGLDVQDVQDAEVAALLTATVGTAPTNDD